MICLSSAKAEISVYIGQYIPEKSFSLQRVAARFIDFSPSLSFLHCTFLIIPLPSFFYLLVPGYVHSDASSA